MHQAKTLSKSFRERIEDVHGGIEALCPLVIAAPGRLIELVDLFLEDGENVAGVAAILQLCDERVRKKILLCAFFVCLQGIVED